MSLELAQEIDKLGSIILSSQTVEMTDSTGKKGYYEITKYGHIRYKLGHWFYTSSYNGQIYEPEDSYEHEAPGSGLYATSVEAAQALIEAYNILAVRDGQAILPPITHPFKSCKQCKFYNYGAAFCAVNPSYLGNGKQCTDRIEKKPTASDSVLRQKFTLAQALLDAGFASSTD